MAEKFWLSKEAFLRMAEISGLDTADRHMEELYAFIQSLLPNFKDLEKLDLTGVEPFMPCAPTGGGGK